jgi:cyclopropane fatty-acyl-phospholipid synthase-like methyltransferase
LITPNAIQDVHTVASHYDELSPYYLALWGEHLHHGLWQSGTESPSEAVRQIVTLVAKESGIKQGDVVCDVGCGYGGTARIFAQEYQAQVTALTISRIQYEYSRKISGNTLNPTFLLQNWLENDLPENFFNVVISIESSEHMEDKGAFFKEAFRVLRPGGCLVVCAWLARERPRDWEVSLFLEPICREGRLPSLGTETTYQQLMTEAGLRRYLFKDLSRQVKKTWPICIRRLVLGFFKDRQIRQFLLKGKSSHRVFAKTLFRIWAAYELGSLGYGIFTAEKPL